MKYLKQVSLCFFLLNSSLLSADIIEISPSADPYSEIQEALILASIGDTIKLSDGYYELEDSLSIDVDGISLIGSSINGTILSFINQQSGSFFFGSTVFDKLFNLHLLCSFTKNSMAR